MNKFKKLLAIVAVFYFMAFTSQVHTYPHIPLKGLFEVLKTDDIGLGHALLHSKWIENVYQYGPGKPHRKVEIKRGRDTSWKSEDGIDLVANLIRKFWFRKNENHQLLPTKFGAFANLPNDRLGAFFGTLINYIYGNCPQRLEDMLVSELLSYDPKEEAFLAELEILRGEFESKKVELQAEKFDSLGKATELLRKEIRRLEQEYKIEMLKKELKAFKKQYKKQKAVLKDVTKKLKDMFKKNEFDQKVEEAEREIFSVLPKNELGMRGEYMKLAQQVRRCQDKINGKIKQRRERLRKALFGPIKAAIEYCKSGNIHIPRITESILWALFFHKLKNLPSEQDKIIAINNCLGCIDGELKNNDEELKELYCKEDIGKLKETISLYQDGDNIGFCTSRESLHYYIDVLRGKFPPKVPQGNHGYEYEEGKVSHMPPDCHESAILDMFGVLWYNPVKNSFDNSLFSEDIIQNGEGFKKLREALKYFYLADSKGIKVQEYSYEYEGRKFTSLKKLKGLEVITPQEVEELDILKIPVSYIKRSEIKQEFMNIVSELPGMEYSSEVPGKGEVFELKSKVSNVIAICSYFYGIEASSIAQIGDILSTDERKITFIKEENKIEDKVNISVNDHKNTHDFTMTVTISVAHTYLTVPKRQEQDALVNKAAQNQKYFLQNQQTFPFFLLFSGQDFMCYKSMPLSLINLYYYSLDMKNEQIACNIIKDILTDRPQNYEMHEGLIHNLLDNPALYNCANIIDVFLVACKKYSNLALEIVRHPRARSNEHFLISVVLQALLNDCPEAVLAILENPQFNFKNLEFNLNFMTQFNFYNTLRDDNVPGADLTPFIYDFSSTGWAASFILAYKKGYKRVMSVIVKHPAMKEIAQCRDGIIDTISEKNVRIQAEGMFLRLLKIEKEDTCIAFEFLKEALKLGEYDIVRTCVKSEAYDSNSRLIIDLLQYIKELVHEKSEQEEELRAMVEFIKK